MAIRLLRRRKSNAARPINSSSAKPSRYQGHTGLEPDGDAALTGTAALDTGAEGATGGAGAGAPAGLLAEAPVEAPGEAPTVPTVPTVPTAPAPLTVLEGGALEVVTGVPSTAAAATWKLAVPVTFEVWPTTRRRWVPTARSAGILKSIFTIPSGSAFVAGRLRGAEYSVTVTVSPLAKPAKSTSWDAPTATGSARTNLGGTVVATLRMVLVTTCAELSGLEEAVGTCADEAGELLTADEAEPAEPPMEELATEEFRTDEFETDKFETDEPGTDVLALDELATDEFRTDESETDESVTDECETDEPTH